MKRRILLSSILTLMLCLSLITGATYALFTSESKVNVSINSGKVELKATLQNLQTYSVQPNQDNTDYEEVTLNGSFLNGGNAELAADGSTITVNKMTPGDKITYEIKLTNNSNIAIKYQTIIQSLNDNGLFNGLKVTIDEEQFNGVAVSKWTQLAGEQQVANTIKVTIELPIEANDTYQNTSTEILTTVNAIQGNAITENEDPNTTYISTAEQLVQFEQEVNAGNKKYQNKTVKLLSDIDLAGIEWTPIYAWDGVLNGLVFDGNNHVIKNLKVKATSTGAYGFFSASASTMTIKNLTFDNALIDANGFSSTYAGVLMGKQYSTGVIENVNVLNSKVLSSWQAGGIIGFAETNGPTFTNCTVDNVFVGGNNATTGALFGLGQVNIVAQNCTINNVRLYTDMNPVAGGIAGYLYGYECTSTNNTITNCTVVSVYDK